MNLQEILESQPELIEKLRTRELTNRQLATQLGYDETYLCKTLTKIGAGKKRGEVVAKRKAISAKAEVRREYRTELAEKVIRNALSIEKAAKLARCSERTMYRYVTKLTSNS